MSKSQRVGENQHRDEIPSFEPRKIKRERNDSFENGTSGLPDFSAGPSNTESDQQQRIPISSRPSNGFHAGDLLQDIIAAKFKQNNHGPAVKNDKIRLMIEDSISEVSKSRVQEIFFQVDQLKIEEKLLLYLKLPTALVNSEGTVDPLRQPLNPLGNRYEIHQTIMWIRTHLEEDPDVSLPKQEVYEEYNIFCTKNSMKPLSTADFGKVMKQVYPKVKPRRLGTRGNSRYCYAGMRKRVKLSTPTLPIITSAVQEDEFDDPITEKMLGAASILIREWAESILGLKFPSLSVLARHLVDNLCVDTHSLSAICIQSIENDTKPSTPKIPETPPSLSTTPVAGKSYKLREAQLQLQKKLQQREHTRDQKHRNNNVEVANQGNKEKIETIIGNQGNSKTLSTSKAKKGKTTCRQSPHTVAVQSTTCKSRAASTSTTPSGRSKKLPKCTSQVSPHCDTTSCNNDYGTREEKLSTKNCRKRTSIDRLRSSSETSPEKQARLAEIIKTEKNSVLPLGSIKSKLIFNCSENLVKTNGKNEYDDAIQNSHVLTKDQINRENSAFFEKNDKLCSIDADALDDYLNGGNNSQEPEEELLQYFQQSNSSSSDAEANITTATATTATILSEENAASRSDKVSQLRLILRENLKTATETTPFSSSLSAISTVQSSLPIEKHEIIQKNDAILPTLSNHSSNPANSRRRVSFETNVIDHSQESNSVSIINTVPQSPNTRRRIFDFTPISPGPHSPINGRAASKPNSANASPFVSPRNTPVPRSRSNMAGIFRSRGQKQYSRSISSSAPYIGRADDKFLVPTSASEECSRRQVSIAAKSPLGSTKCSTSSSTTDLPIGVSNATTRSNRFVAESKRKTLSCAPFLATDLNNQSQLVINYPSQENLQEIKNTYRPAADREISELLNGVKASSSEHYYRSQSVPLHRMVNPTLMSPISTQSYQLPFPSPSFNLSSNSSIAPTPVPSEFNDFGSTYLLDEVDANFIADDQQFLMEDKEISSENITKILNFLDEEEGKGLNILPEPNEESLIDDRGGLLLDPLPNSNLNLPDTILEPPTDNSIDKIIQSTSYSNTALPPTTCNTFPPPPQAFSADDSNGSRSYPTTPLHAIQSQSVYRERNEPMLSSPTLNSLNLCPENGHPGSAESTCRNVADLLETNFLGDSENDATHDLDDPLSNFDGLQDVDSLAPLFNEVADAATTTNR